MLQLRSRAAGFALATGLLLALASGGAQAQMVDVPALLTADAEKDTWVIGTYAHQFESDVDSGGDVEKNIAMFGFGHRFQLGDDWSLALQSAYRGNYYKFQGAGPFQWEDIHELALAAIVGWDVSDDWTLLGGGLFNMAGEGGADFEDAITAGGLIGFDYRWSDTLSTGLLIGLQTQLEDSAALLPIPTLNWKFADAWRLQVGLLNVAGEPGIGPEITWSFADDWDLAVGAGFQKRRFRLDNHSTSAIPPTQDPDKVPNPNKDGIGQEQSVPVYARVRFAPSDSVSFDFMGGAVVYGQVRVEDDDGDKLRRSDYDPAAFVSLRANILF